MFPAPSNRIMFFVNDTSSVGFAFVNVKNGATCQTASKGVVGSGCWSKICFNSLKVTKMKEIKNKTHRNVLKSNFIQRFSFNTSMYLPWPSNSSIHAGLAFFHHQQGFVHNEHKL